MGQLIPEKSPKEGKGVMQEMREQETHLGAPEGNVIAGAKGLLKGKKLKY